MSVTFVSYPVVYEDIILGIEWGMALSTVATALAFIVLAVMLRNIRQLALVLANILCAIGTTLLIMCARGTPGRVDVVWFPARPL